MTGERAKRESYTLFSIASLIVGAIAIGWLFWTGREIGVQTERAELIAAIWRHVGYGVISTPLLLAYLWFRITLLRTSRADWISRSAFWLLGAGVLFLLATGPIVVWTYGSDLKVFDWFVIPNPIGEMPAIHDPLEAAHVLVAKIIPWLLAIDFGLALIRSRKRRRLE